MPKFTDEFWHRVRTTYVESWQDGRNLSLVETARVYSVDPDNVQRRAAREGWTNQSRIAAAMGKSLADQHRLVGPVVQAEVQEQLASPQVATSIQRRADEAVSGAIEARVQPMAEMMEAHGLLIQQVEEVGAALMALGVDSLPEDGEKARQQGWTPSEVLRAMELSWKLREASMKWGRITQGLPTSVRVSQANVDARHTFQGMDSALEALGGLSVADLAAKLRDAGAEVPDPGIVDAEFTVEEVPPSGWGSPIPQS